MQDTAYVQAKAVADAAFEYKLRQFSTDLEKVAAGWSASEFSAFPVQAVEAMAATTGRYLAEVTNMLQWLYERAFVHAPALRPETLAAIETDLADHVAGQLNIVVAMYQGKVHSCGGNLVADNALPIQVKHLRGQIEQAVLAIMGRR